MDEQVYQHKTTMVSISVGDWDEQTNEDCPVSLRFDAVHSIAAKIATHCHMDIISFAACPLPNNLGEGVEYHATVVYSNNGLSHSDIIRIMGPELEINSKQRPSDQWMIQDMEAYDGVIWCVATVRGVHQGWD